jgi:hypothetical protein
MNSSPYYQPIQPKLGASYDDSTYDYGTLAPSALSTSGLPGYGNAAPASPVQDTNWAPIAGAGVQAAGATIGTLAQIIAQSQARQQALAEAGIDRSASEALAKMKIKAAAEMADKERAQAAQQFLMQSLLKKGAGALNNWDVQRAANKSGSSLLAQAFLGG